MFLQMHNSILFNDWSNTHCIPLGTTSSVVTHLSMGTYVASLSWLLRIVLVTNITGCMGGSVVDSARHAGGPVHFLTYAATALLGLPAAQMVKNLLCKAGDQGLMSGLGRGIWNNMRNRNKRYKSIYPSVTESQS